jgi:hypothetical protein
MKLARGGFILAGLIVAAPIAGLVLAGSAAAVTCDPAYAYCNTDIQPTQAAPAPLSTGPASSSTNSPSPTTPATMTPTPTPAITWFDAAPPAPYADSAPPAAVMEDLKVKGIVDQRIVYYSPQGGAPSADSVDIQLRNMVPSATDTLTFNLNLFPQFSSDIGTTLQAGQIVPTADDTGLPTVLFGDSSQYGIVVIKRAPIPADCSATDPSSQIVHLAMLGENQHKYMIDVALTWGARSDSALKAWNARCEALSTPTPTAAALPQGPSNISTYGSATTLPGYNYGPPIGYSALLVVAIFVLVWLYRRFRVLARIEQGVSVFLGGSRFLESEFNHDGTDRIGHEALEPGERDEPTPLARRLSNLLFPKK